MLFEGLEAIQTINEDGTIKLRIIDLGAYYNEVAIEISKTYKSYSDVQIVCGDGSKFYANKSILSRHRSFSQYLHTNDQSGERTCLIFPEIDSKQMKEALQWFYDVSSFQNSYGVSQSPSVLDKVFGAPNSQALTKTNTDSKENSLVDDEECWEILFPRDFSSRYFNCPLCEGKFRDANEIQRHLSVHNLSTLQPEVLKSQKTVILSSNAKSLRGSEETTSKFLSEDNVVKLSLKYQCFACSKRFKSRYSLICHVGWIHFKKKVLSLAPMLCKKKSCPTNFFSSRRRVYHLSQKHNALKHCLTEDQYQSVITESAGQSTFKHPTKPSDGKNLPKPKILAHERSSSTKEEIQSSVENHLVEVEDVEFVPPFATNTKSLNAFFDGAKKIFVSTANLEKWSPEKRIFAKSGNVFIFRGTYENLTSVNQADNLSWHLSTKKFRNKKKTVYFIARPDTLKLTKDQRRFLYTSKVLDFYKVQFRKKVVFLEQESIFFIHYYGIDDQLPWIRNYVHQSEVSLTQVRSFEETEKESEDRYLNLAFQEALPDKDRLPWGFPIKPYLQKQFSLRLDSPFLEEILEMVAKKNVELQTWGTDKFMDPTCGNLYVFHGNEQQFEHVQFADNIVWNSYRTNSEDDTCKRAYFVAKPDKTKLTIFQRSLLRKYKPKPYLRKKVCFYYETSVFVVIYHGNCFHIPWVKKGNNQRGFTGDESKSYATKTNLASRKKIEPDARRIIQTIPTKDRDVRLADSPQVKTSEKECSKSDGSWSSKCKTPESDELENSDQDIEIIENDTPHAPQGEERSTWSGIPAVHYEQTFRFAQELDDQSKEHFVGKPGHQVSSDSKKRRMDLKSLSLLFRFQSTQ